VIAPEGVNRRGQQIALVLDQPRLEQILRLNAQRPAQPFIDQDAEDSHGTLDQLGRHMHVNDLPQGPLNGSAASDADAS